MDYRETLINDFTHNDSSVLSDISLTFENGKHHFFYEYITFGIGVKIKLSETSHQNNFMLYEAEFSFFGDAEEIITNEELFNNLLKINKAFYDVLISQGNLDGYCISLSNKSYSKQELVIFNFFSKILSTVKDAKKRTFFRNIVFQKDKLFNKPCIFIMTDSLYAQLELKMKTLIKIADYLYNKPLLFNANKLTNKQHIIDSLLYSLSFSFMYYGRFVTVDVDFKKGVTLNSGDLDLVLEYEVNSSQKIEAYLEEIKNENVLHNLIIKDFIYLKEFLKREFQLYDFEKNYFYELRSELLEAFPDYDFLESEIEKRLKEKNIAFEKVYVEENNHVETCARKLKIGEREVVFFELYPSDIVKVLLNP